MYGSQAFSGFSNVYHFACVRPTALKLGSIANFDMLFLVIGFISLVDEIQFMLISSRHICIRSILETNFALALECTDPSLPAATVRKFNNPGATGESLVGKQHIFL